MPDNISVIVDTAIASRHSVRAFRQEPVPHDVIGNILEVASRAPSSANMQPWRVYVLIGAARQHVVDAACYAYDHEPGQHTSELQYYPSPLFEPYLSRRRKLGIALYSLLGLKKEDREGMHRQQRRNLTFFDAPVGMIFTIHRDLTNASLLDYGAFLQNIMIAARGRGLDTCMLGAWSTYHRLLVPELQLGQEEMVLGGMALGYADADALVNQLQADRLPLSEFVVFRQV